MSISSLPRTHEALPGGVDAHRLRAVRRLAHRAWQCLLIALGAAFALSAACAQTISASFGVSLPNGYANLRSNDLQVSSSIGSVPWSRQWDGHEWKFNPQWESLSHSWANMTGSAEVEYGSDDGCWVWVDEDWRPSLETVEIGGVSRPVMLDGVAQAKPMLAARTTPFNRTITGASAANSANYPPAQRVSLDYATLCLGAKAHFVDEEAIRRGNELFLGDAGRYMFDNRAMLEKRAVRQIAFTAAPASRSTAVRLPLVPENNPKGYRWHDRSGNWMDYNTQGQVVAVGERNGNAIWLQRDDAGRLVQIADDQGRVLMSLHYTGDLLTEVRDAPAAAISGDLPARSVKYRYDDRNRLIEVTDVRGNTVQYGYDAGNHLTRITDQEGRAERIAYAGDTVKQSIAPDGGVTDYEFDYDDNRRQFISKITGPATAAGRRVEDYIHNRSGKLVRRTVNGRTEAEIRYDNGARAETRTNVRGFATTTTRNEFDQIVEIRHPDGSTQKKAYSALHMGITEETDELGIKTKYEHDAKGNLLKTVEAVGTPDERITEHQVNDRGQTIRVTRKGRTESNGSVTPDATWQIAYDTQGNISQATDPEGHQRSYVFNRAGALLKHTDPLGNATVYETDAAGNLTKIINPLGHVRSFSYDKTGNRTGSIDARDKTTRIAYDTMNRLIQSSNAAGGQYKRRYDAKGSVIGETDEDGRAKTIEYDLFQRISREADALDNVTTYGYQLSDGSATGMPGSLFGPTEIRYPSFARKLRYDARERLSSESLTYANSRGLQTATISASYDARGQIKSETEVYGKTRSRAYDALGQIIEVVDALGGKTQARHDTRGNLMEVIDATGNSTRFVYNASNRLTSETLPLGQVIRYSYDTAGRLAERIDPTGAKKRYTYDAANRITQAQHQTQAGVIIRTVSLTWDAEDNLTAWSDIDLTRPAGQQTASAVLTYDDAGRKTSETVSYPNPVGGSYSLGYGYQYSPAGKKTRLTWADGTAISYGYSAHGELQSVSIPGEGSISVNQYQWRAPALLTLPGGVTQEKTWDGVFNLQAQRSKTPGQITTLNLANSYGMQGEMKTANRTDTVNGTSSTRASSYGYDDELRLTSATTNTGGLFGRDTETFGLDGLANRTTHSRTGSGAWQYDQNQRLLQRPGAGGNGTVSYVYDANGNQTQKTEGTSTTRYRYDGDNRLIEVQNGAGNPIARYGYDPMNRRIWKEQYRDRAGQPVTPASRIYFLYADEGMVAEATQEIAINANDEASSSQAPVITTQYGLNPNNDFMTGILFIKTKNGNGTDVFAYYHGDHLGVPLQATDKAGNVLWAANYNAFGRAEILMPSTAIGNSLINSHIRLPGQYEDVETGLHYNFHRYYDPDIGGYIQSDPIGLNGGWNRFAYVNGQPLSKSDPTGLLLGNYFNTGECYGVSAAQYWANAHVKNDNSLYAIPGAFAALWTPKTSDVTVGILFGISGEIGIAKFWVNFPLWLTNPIMYEIGQKTLSEEDFVIYSKIKNPVERGKVIVRDRGWLKALLPAFFSGSWYKTVRTGATPGAAVFLTIAGPSLAFFGGGMDQCHCE